MFFNDWLSRRRLYTPDRVAVVDDSDGRHYTYAELDERAMRLANLLQQRHGVRPGDRVACLSTNRIEYIDLYYACGKIGAVLAPLNFRFPTAEILEVIADCRPTLFVYEEDYAETAKAVGRTGITCISMVSGAEQATSPHKPHHADENDVAMILYTSGTTGRAKGAMIPWRQIHWNALNTIIGLQMTQGDVAFLNTPLYHTGGWHVLFTPLMLLGGRVILQKKFDAARCNERIGPEGVTILFGIPTMLRMMQDARNFAAADFSSVRFAICGGEPCPLPVIDAYQGQGVAIRQGYGLTEAGPNCFSLPAEDAIRKQGSIGYPNFHIATRLVNDAGQDVGVGEIGELWMKGPHTFAGYWGNAAETAKILRDGWVCTGDLMRRDEEGYHFVVGRKKEMYISGGENVYPAQIERVLQSHDAVALAAVVGVPDAKWGETGWAFVKLLDGCSVTEEQLAAWCKQHLAGFQCPSKIVVTTELPIGHSGKIDKLALRQRAAEMSGKP